MDGQYLTVEIHPNNHCEIFKLFIILQHNDQELLALESNCLDPSPGSATNSATLGKLPHFSIAQCSLPKNGDDVTYFKKMNVEGSHVLIHSFYYQQCCNCYAHSY